MAVRITFELRAFWSCPVCLAEQSHEMRPGARSNREWIAPIDVMCRDCGETFQVESPLATYRRATDAERQASEAKEARSAPEAGHAPEA